MKLKVGYSTTIPVSAYGIKDNAWCEIEVEVNSLAEYKEKWFEVKETVDAAVKEKYPNIQPATSIEEPIIYGGRTEEEISRDQQVQGYYEIIKIAKTKKQLEMHRGNIEKLGGVALSIAFENRLNELP